MRHSFLAGLIAARERFSFKKFILAAGYLLVYLGIVVMVYAVGKYQDDTQEALYVVKVITYVFIYFYSSNILKNLHLLMPDNPVIRFLDYFIGLQFTRKVAWLEEFLKKEQQGAGADGTEDDAERRRTKRTGGKKGGDVSWESILRSRSSVCPPWPVLAVSTIRPRRRP